MEDNTKTTLDQIRAATVGAKKQFRTKIVNYNGVDIELRQPSVKNRMECMEHSKNEDGSQNIWKYVVSQVIANTFVPGSDVPVFSDADYDSLLSQPTGSFVDTFSEVIAEMSNIDRDELKKK